MLLEQIEPRGQIKAVRLTETVGQHQRRIQLLAGGAARNSFGPVTVSGDGFLALGDNRDNCADSRYFGFVSRHLLIGQANHILVSADIKGNWLPRPERFGQRLQQAVSAPLGCTLLQRTQQHLGCATHFALLFPATTLDMVMQTACRSASTGGPQ